MNIKLIAMLAVLFIVTQSIGLMVADKLIQENVSATLITDNPEDVENSIGLIAYILVFTAVLLIAIKYFGNFSGILFKIFESLAIFGASILVFYTFTQTIFVFVFALLLVLVRIVFSKNIWLRNLSSVIATAGAGALMGVSLGILPVIVFMVLLAIYDFIAVFKTKHMITLANAIKKKNLSFTYALPTKEHQFELGTGDLVIPLVFSTSILKANKALMNFPEYFFPSAIILTVSFIGLIATIYFVSKKPGKALPALPLQVMLMVLVYGLMQLL
ncbi:MAG: presenilin family intramembrane aspartyl protease [Candidatus Diapherotrites archaeon]